MDQWYGTGQLENKLVGKLSTTSDTHLELVNAIRDAQMTVLDVLVHLVLSCEQHKSSSIRPDIHSSLNVTKTAAIIS
jgi:hypothetical protein